MHLGDLDAAAGFLEFYSTSRRHYIDEYLV